MREEDFYDKVKDSIIFKNLQGEYKPFADYLDTETSEENAMPKAIYYVSDEAQQAQYIAMFKEAGLDAMICDTLIDSHFLSFLEYKQPKSARFIRIDADLDGALKTGETAEEDGKEIVELFKEKLVNKNVAVKAERLKTGKIPAVINVEEFMRRMSEMQGMYGMEGFDPMKNATLVLNLTNPVVSAILTQSPEKQELIVNQIYYLAMLSYQKLSPEDLSDFVDKSTKILFELTK